MVWATLAGHELRRTGWTGQQCSGDWVENLTALEYNFGEWSIYHYHELDYELANPKLDIKLSVMDLEEVFRLQNPKAAFLTQFLKEDNSAQFPLSPQPI